MQSGHTKRVVWTSLGVEEMNGTVPSWGLRSPIAVGLIGVKGRRSLFMVRREEMLQKLGYCSGRARLGISPSQNVTDT